MALPILWIQFASSIFVILDMTTLYARSHLCMSVCVYPSIYPFESVLAHKHKPS